MAQARFVRTVVLVTLALTGLSAGPAQASHLDAVPLRGPVPAWYTPELHERVLAADPAGVTLPPAAEREVPLSSLAYLGIRPGQLLIVDDRALCTSNFVFSTEPFPTLLGADGGATETKHGKDNGNGRGGEKSKAGEKSNGRKAGGGKTTSASGSTLFIGTAGHCGKTGDPVVMLFAPLGLVYIGDIVKSTDGGVGEDFALIAIKPELNSYVSPSVAHWGGPTGVYTGGPITVHHTGWGLGVGAGGTPRAGVAYRFTSSEWRFESAVTPGDSGSGAIVTGGLGAGNITHLVVDTREQVPVYMAGTSLTKIMTMVGDLYLATCAPVPWPLPGCPANL